MGQVKFFWILILRLKNSAVPVGQGGGRAVSPARAAINGNVLVSGERKEVPAVDVSPEPIFRNFLDIEVVLRPRAGDDVGLVGLDDLAGLFLGQKGRLFLDAGFGFVPLVVGPGVPGHGPRAHGLDGAVVLAPDDSEPALLAFG